MMHVFEAESSHVDSRRAALVELLQDAVAHGASVGFLAGLELAQASDYWAGVKAAMRDGSRRLWLAECNGKLFGAVQLDLCQRGNGANRAEVQKLLVHSSERRLGVARSLMTVLETTAHFLERGLLYLDTEAGSPAEALYENLGYTRVGVLPQHACTPDGEWRDTAIYYKTLLTRSAK